MISIPFFNWFVHDLIIGGDWRFFWPENLREMSSYALAWDTSLNTGIGRSNIFYLWLNSYLGCLGHFYVNILHIPWSIAEKLLFFWPIFFLSFFAAFILSRRVVKNPLFNVLAGIIYLTNSYALMIFGGGQVGIALSYAIAPLGWWTFMELVDTQKIRHFPIKEVLVAGLVLSLQVMWDIRIAFISLIVILLYTLLFIVIHKGATIGQVLLSYFITGLIVFGIHAFWIVPVIITKGGGVETLGEAYTNVSAIDFFSFASFSNTISLLHPNWPENIFGKIHFMQPEFILIPIIAFGALLRKHNKRTTIYFFSLLALCSAFLSKGVNEPFGFVYRLLFRYVPGFVMFRDPTKFYFLIAISYSVLIPFALKGLSDKLKYFKWLPVLLFLFFWMWTVRPLWLGELSGTFRSGKVPQQYNELRNFIAGQPEYFRTIWVPQRQRFGFFSNTHPAIDSVSLSKTASASGVLGWLSGRDAQETLSQWSIKYVIVPYDSEGELFLENRTYSPDKRRKIEKGLDKIPWLKKNMTFHDIAVYEVPQYVEHFYAQQPDPSMKIAYRMVDPTKYSVHVTNARTPFNLIFAEGYDRNWEAIVGNETIKSTLYRQLQNSFNIRKTGDFEIIVAYKGQKYVNLSLFITYVTLIICLIGTGRLIYCHKKYE